jgi:pyruvate dehydrogenase E1 component
MLVEQQDVFYYVTVMNENYAHPAMPPGAEEGILKGLYLFREGAKGKDGLRVQLLGSSTILREVIAAADLLADDWGVSADIWSATSFNQLRREGLDCMRWNLMHPEETPRQSHVEVCLKGRSGPVIAATDYMKAYADQIREFVPSRYVALGTDGFGRSDTREKLRRFFEVDRFYVALAALKALAEGKAIPASRVADAIRAYQIDPNKPNPVTV